MFEVELSMDRRESGCLQNYLQSIGRYDLITREKEYELARLIKQGDRDALDELVNANLRFVVTVAKKFLNQGLSYMDLIAEGNIGLITAADRFDETREFRFISYAVWWIRQSIQKAIAEQTNTVRLPVNRTQQVQKIKKITREFEQKYYRLPSDSELSERVEIPLVKMALIKAASRPLASLDENIFDSEDMTLSEILADESMPNPEDGFLQSEVISLIGSALDILTLREKDVVSRYYGLGDLESVSLETIGQDLNLSRERIRQVRNQALFKIRKHVDSMETTKFAS
ncbi:MAG: sigma-70 family RNA polymerase sigma factor [bacterium]|nr:sigma-70 family RNA polymerase sigma factor [bacterium]MCP4799846.1 sigma-70 family RNA polymerase sigma factor [bacterium]